MPIRGGRNGLVAEGSGPGRPQPTPKHCVPAGDNARGATARCDIPADLADASLGTNIEPTTRKATKVAAAVEPTTPHSTVRPHQHNASALSLASARTMGAV